MARTARSWYFTEKRAYAAHVKGQGVILVEGDENPTNPKLAAKKLRQVLKGSRSDIARGSLRVADVIERYLKLRRTRYSELAFEQRKRYLQLFAEAHGWRKVNDRDVCPSDPKKRVRPSSAARFRQILVFLRFTGCRPGEARRLQWRDIDLEHRVIVLRRHKTAKKTRRPRVIPLHSVALKLLTFVRRLNQPGEHVFLTHRKTPWHRVSLAQRLRRVRQAAGVAEDAKLYGLRHRFGTTAILRGVDLKTLSELTNGSMNSLGGSSSLKPFRLHIRPHQAVPLKRESPLC